METIILFGPLAGALIAGFGWKLIGETASQWLTTGLLFLSAFLSWVVFLSFDGVTESIQIMRWIESGSLSTDWGIRMDRLTATMLIVITTVSALVHLYSFGYMAHDENFKEGENYKARFFAYLSFFTFAMLMLVTADNLVQMFFGWEGVGVASYLLIGFYYKKPSANAAAIKAFVVNRVGDFGFLLGIFALYLLTDSIRLEDIFAAVPMLAETQLEFLGLEFNAANLIGVLLFIGAMGKSAQLFLHTWLPDAMEGPTPVSALIHAATMVTAGVFLVCRMSPLYEFAPEAKQFIVIIGALASSAHVVWKRPDRSADALLTGVTVSDRSWFAATAEWLFAGRRSAPKAGNVVRGNLLIALGVLLAAGSALFAYLSQIAGAVIGIELADAETTGHAIGLAVGVVVMYAGFRRTLAPIETPHRTPAASDLR